MRLDADAPMIAAGRPSPNPAELGRPVRLPPDIVSASMPPLQTLDIIGRDDRQSVPSVRLAPWQMVCHLLLQDTGGQVHTGTGWLSGPSTVFTAGHNLLYRKIGHRAVRVWVVPGRDGAEGPHGQFEATGFDIHPQWRAGDVAEFDVGVIWLPQPVGQSLGWFGFSAQPDRVLQGLAVRTSGYPDDRQPFGSQWFADSRIHAARPQMLAYGLDTMPGQSGSPVFALDADARAVAVGVHVYGAGRENLGVRITQPIFDTLSGWWR